MSEKKMAILVNTIDRMMFEIASIFKRKKVGRKEMNAIANYYREILYIMEELK